jgi:hypothetical protein
MFLSRRKSSPSPRHITPPGYVLVPLNTKTKSVLSQLNSDEILQPAPAFPTATTSIHNDYNNNDSSSGFLPGIKRGKCSMTSSWVLSGGSCDSVLDGCGFGGYIQQEHPRGFSVSDAMRGHGSKTCFDDCQPPPQQQKPRWHPASCPSSCQRCPSKYYKCLCQPHLAEGQYQYYYNQCLEDEDWSWEAS